MHNCTVIPHFAFIQKVNLIKMLCSEANEWRKNNIFQFIVSLDFMRHYWHEILILAGTKIYELVYKSQFLQYVRVYQQATEVNRWSNSLSTERQEHNFTACSLQLKLFTKMQVNLVVQLISFPLFFCLDTELMIEYLRDDTFHWSLF